MKKIYACLVGEWVCLNDDPECKMVYTTLRQMYGMKKTHQFLRHSIETLRIAIINWTIFISITKAWIIESIQFSFRLLNNSFI